MVVNGKPRPGRNGMKSPRKYSMLHAEARYDRRWCIILKFHRTTYPDTKLSISSPEYRYQYYYSLDTSTDIDPIETANGNKKPQLYAKAELHDYIRKLQNETCTLSKNLVHEICGI